MAVFDLMCERISSEERVEKVERPKKRYQKGRNVSSWMMEVSADVIHLLGKLSEKVIS